MPKYVYQGPGPRTGPDGVIAYPGTVREFAAEPDWGPWKLLAAAVAEVPPAGAPEPGKVRPVDPPPRPRPSGPGHPETPPETPAPAPPAETAGAPVHLNFRPQPAARPEGKM